MGLLTDRGIVITGAGRGLGRSFAIGAAREGANVVVNDIDDDIAQSVVDEIVAEGNRAIAAAGSVSDWQAAQAIIDCCVTEFGSIDGLVNNAVSYSFGHPWDETPAQLRKQVEVNILGAMYCGAQAMSYMKEQQCGSIVNLTSNVMMGKVGMSTYGIAKGALASATFGWALEMMPYGVRVNALAPGAMTRAADFAGTFGRPDKRDDPSPDSIAPAAVYLLSDLSAGVTGQVVLLMGKRLGVISHPVLLEPVLEKDEWSAEDIAVAYSGVLRRRFQPVGRDAVRYEWQPDPTD